MMKTNLFTIICAVAAIGCAHLGIRVGFRYLALGGITRLPSAEQRIQSVPVRLDVSQPADRTHYVDLGYASFYTPEQFELEAWPAGDGTCLVLTNNRIRLLFLAPFSITSFRADRLNGNPITQNAKMEYPKLSRQTELMYVDPVQAEIDIEYTLYPNFWQVLALNRDAFTALKTRLMHKAVYQRGQNKVLLYKSDQTKGLVRIGDFPDDPSVLSGMIASVQGDCLVGFHLYRKHKVEQAVDELLVTILSSFSFAVDEIPDQAQLIDLIAATGVKHRKHSQQDESVPSEAAPSAYPDVR